MKASRLDERLANDTDIAVSPPVDTIAILCSPGARKKLCVGKGHREKEGVRTLEKKRCGEHLLIPQGVAHSDALRDGSVIRANDIAPA